MTTNTENAYLDTQIEDLRTFATKHNADGSLTAFAHMCTQALGGDEWSRDLLRDYAGSLHAFTGHALLLEAIRATDCTRPDGLIARGGIEV